MQENRLEKIKNGVFWFRVSSFAGFVGFCGFCVSWVQNSEPAKLKTNECI